MQKHRLSMRQRIYLPFKRAIDIILSLLGCVILSPVLLVICIAIKLDSKGPVLFKQKRVGIHKDLFYMYKFRTMYTETPKDMPTHLLSNPDQYITKVGHFLRKTSLDELPQIFNILKGDMSIIGPRPALWNQDDLIAERDKYGANDVRPGLSGWAQINGRDELEIPYKASLDGVYVKKMGLLFDLRCFFGTFLSVLRHDGVVEGGTGEMKKHQNKRVLILVNLDLTIYKFRFELVERLVKEGYEVYISSPYGDFIDEFTAIGCQFIDTQIERHGMNPVQDLKLLRNYIGMMKKVKPLVVLSYTIKPNIYGGVASQRCHVPFIANITGLGSTVQKSGILLKWVTLLYRIAFRKIHCVFVQNKENENYFSSHNIATGKYRLIPGSGVNLEHYPLRPYEEKDGIHFAFIGRVMKEKGIEEYLDAAKNVKKKHPEAKFHIYGFCEEEYEDMIEEYQKEGIVNYHGMVRDMATVLGDINCGVLPSYHEGMANCLLEAAASGRPVMASDITGCRETFEDGVSGILFQVRDSRDLARAMEQFLSLSTEERRAMGLAGRKKVEQEFDRNIVINAYMDEIEKISKGVR